MNFYLVINRKFRLTVIYWRCYSIINFQFFSPHLVFKSLWKLLRTVLLNWKCKNKAWSCKRFNTYLAWKKSSRIVLYDFSPPFFYLFCLLKYCLDQMYFSYRFDTKPLFTFAMSTCIWHLNAVANRYTYLIIFIFFILSGRT